jgi:hypothetical protein
MEGVQGSNPCSSTERNHMADEPSELRINKEQLAQLIDTLLSGATVIGGHPDPEGMHIVLDTIAGEVTIVMSNKVSGKLLKAAGMI